MIRSRSLAIVIISAVMSGCALVNRTLIVPPTVPLPAEPVALEYTVLHKADYNLDDRKTIRDYQVLDNAGSYKSTLAAYSVEVPKPVDFATQRVVRATMGTQATGGYAVSVVSVEEFDEQLLVTVELRVPGEHCITTSALSNPYEFTLIPSVKAVEFVESEVVQQCEPG